MEVTPLNNVLGLPSKDLERFLSKFDRSGDQECWIWTSHLRDGYGGFTFGPQGTLRWRAHRLCYELSIGPIPPGKQLHHTCNDRSCVNPAHMEIIDPAEHTKKHARYLVLGGFCKNGHLVTEETLHRRSDGRPFCIACARATRTRIYRRDHPIQEREPRTHCPKGHELVGDNVFIYKFKTKTSAGECRQCKRCRNDRVMRYIAKNRRVLKAKERVRKRIRLGKTNFSELERSVMPSMRLPQ